MKSKLLKAAKNADWQQVVLNGGPPCFHLEDGRFCLRAERWDGHKAVGGSEPIHKFVSLETLLCGLLLPHIGRLNPVRHFIPTWDWFVDTKVGKKLLADHPDQVGLIATAFKLGMDAANHPVNARACPVCGRSPKSEPD